MNYKVLLKIDSTTLLHLPSLKIVSTKTGSQFESADTLSLKSNCLTCPQSSAFSRESELCPGNRNACGLQNADGINALRKHNTIINKGDFL